jgi:hypothetical protein
MNAGGDSPPSPVASATTNAAADTIAPSAPTGLKAASAKSKVNLSWTGSTDTGGSGLVGYTLWRAPSATGSFTSVGTTAGTSYTTAGTSYSDASVTGNVDYWYRVTALDGAGNQSQNSNVVSARPK